MNKVQVRITLKNYRAFSDEAPLIVEWGNGFTALVGQNNSGKSSLLRFFYEARNIFTNTANALVNGFGEVSGHLKGKTRSCVLPLSKRCGKRQDPAFLSPSSAGPTINSAANDFKKLTGHVVVWFPQ